MKFYEDIQTKLKNSLKESRYNHTIGVMFTAASMAMAHKYDINKAMLAGLLHDCAKCLPFEEQVKLCTDNNKEISEYERENKALLHSKAGAILAKIEYDIKDEEILHAIEYHTTSIPNMGTLDKIIFIADYIEPNRKMLDGLTEFRKLAFMDLDETMYGILKNTLQYLQTRQGSGSIDETTRRAYEFYEKKRLEKGE